MHNTADAVSHIEFCPFRSPLIGTSQLVSFPPLSNMLKFSGYLSSNSGNKFVGTPVNESTTGTYTANRQVGLTNIHVGMQ